MTVVFAFFWRNLGRRALVLLAAAALAGCSTIGYYAQAVQGHLALMHAARPIGDWLRDPATPAVLKARLELAQRLRAYAVTALDLPDNASYHGYADLHRAAAVWNVAAAPVDSLTLKRWCFPVLGCVGYRGYYDEAAAQALAAELRAQDGLEVTVYGVPAYSTLGWMNWAGGDPLVSTIIAWPAGALARILFHELAHQRVYAKGDTMFNESYATAVGRLGAAQWLAGHADDAARGADARWQAHQQAFRALTRATRAELAAVYEQKGQDGLSEPALLALKTEAMARFRERYQALKARWAAAGMPYGGYDAWVAHANNASFALQAAYDEWVPGFEALFAQQGRDWPRFHAAVQQLAALPAAERDAQLRALTAVQVRD